MPMYRCQNAHCSTDPHGRLIFDFESDVPKCPKCGADQRAPKTANMIVTLKTMHYEPPSGSSDTYADKVDGPMGKFFGVGRGDVACSPGKKPKCGEHHGITGDAHAVTCKACKATDVWSEATRTAREPHVAEMQEVRVDLVRGVTEFVK